MGSRKRIKQYLMLLLVIGVVAVAASGGGTFASFSATVSNNGNTFTTGTMFLHQDPNGGTACYSEWQTTVGGAVTTDNTNSSCDALFSNIDLTSGLQKAYVTLTNAGSTDASSITAQVTGCSFGANDTSEPRFNTSLTCGDVEVAIQEVGSASTSGTALYCAYGTDTSGTCGLDASHNLGSSSGELGNATPTTLLKAASTDANLTKSGGSADTRYYVVEIQPNTGALSGNDLQNQKLSFGITWGIAQ